MLDPSLKGRPIAVNNVPGGGGFVGGAACSQP